MTVNLWVQVGEVDEPENLLLQVLNSRGRRVHVLSRHEFLEDARAVPPSFPRNRPASLPGTRTPQRFAEFFFGLHPTCKRVLESLLGIIQHDQTAMLCLERMVVIELPGVDNRDVRRAVLRQNLFETSDHFLNLLSD